VLQDDGAKDVGRVSTAPLINQLLALRSRVPDATLLDWLDLEQLLPTPPCHVETDLLRQHWHCTQPNVSRRLGRLWTAGLIDYRSGGGLYRIRRLGPNTND
jgi:hypothetical protein